MKQVRHLIGLILVIAGPVAHAKIGVQSPSKLIYGSGSAEAGFIILKECFLSDLEPSQDCDKIQGTNQAKPGAEDLPAIIALRHQDFIRAALFSDESAPKLHAREISRYMAANGRRNLDADINTFEEMLSSKEVDKDEVEEIRKELERLQFVSERLRRGDTMIEKIMSADMNLVTPFNSLWKSSEAAFKRPEKDQLIYERTQRLWVRYLGSGDYSDATGTPRLNVGSGSENGVDQKNLGGCIKAYGNEYRLPTSEELKLMRRNVPFSTAIKDLFNIEIDPVFILATRENPYYYASYSYEGRENRLAIRPILCVINAGP